MALWKDGIPEWICFRDIKCNEKGTITGTLAEHCTINNFIFYRNAAIKCVKKMVHPSITDVVTNEPWQRVKIHSLSLMECVSRGT